MHSTTHTAASMPIRNGGMLARLSDTLAIAAGASLSAWASGVVDDVGFASALVAFSMLFALLFFPSWGMYRVARTRLFWRCVCIPVLAWLIVLGTSCVLVMALHRGYGYELFKHKGGIRSFKERVGAIAALSDYSQVALSAGEFSMLLIGGRAGRALRHVVKRILGEEYVERLHALLEHKRK
ncbi:hypothetical protein [Paraburkholderia tropica]|uniref:hypothetical protein n=1 Tax=Paraburkholderia tropica TaxID=92647 RepID=UPI002AB061A3|nr:hypothetical protein [Paraburkholderia tropica]